MTDTWYTSEVIRCLTTDADVDEIQELLEEAEDEAADVLEKWVRQGNAPRASMMRCCVLVMGVIRRFALSIGKQR